jgi:hypothetical protein
VLVRFSGGNAEEEPLTFAATMVQGQAGIRSVFPFPAVFLLFAIPAEKKCPAESITVPAVRSAVRRALWFLPADSPAVAT